MPTEQNNQHSEQQAQPQQPANNQTERPTFHGTEIRGNINGNIERK